MTTLDARGISCPEPVIMLKKALKAESDITLLVDNKIAFQNCEGFAKMQGCTVETEKDDDEYKMRIKKA